MANEIVQVTVTEPTATSVSIGVTAPTTSVTDVHLDTIVVPGVERYVLPSLVLTNSPLAKRFVGNLLRSTAVSVDLSSKTQVRMQSVCTVASISASNPRLLLQYNIGYSESAATYADLGVTEISASITTTGLKDTGWVDLAPGAITSGVLIALMELGGDGVADPQVGLTIVEFR